MTTSGSYDNTTNLLTIIRDSFSLVNIIDDKEPLPPDMYSYGKRKLNELMSFLSTRRGLWLISDITVTLVPGTQSYTIGVGLEIDTPMPMEIVDARRVDSATSEVPIKVISRSDYMSLPNKTLRSNPLSVYYDKQRDNGVLYVYPTGTTTSKTLILTVHRPIQDFDSLGNNPDLPKEWIMPITYLLAQFISPKYLGGVIPSDIKSMSDGFLVALMNADEEKTSVNFKIGVK